MPKSWGPTRERQYQRIKASERKRGRSAKESERIAAATVNKQRAARRRKGR